MFRDLRHTDRLVLDYGHSRWHALAINHVIRELSDTSTRFGPRFKERFPREYTNAWVSRLTAGKDKGLRLTMDFKQGMGAVEGVLFEMGQHGGIRNT
jgi:hypothetical protein